MSEVTIILNAIQAGDAGAAQRLLPLVYDELRRLARAKMATDRPGQTLDATALVHEAYLRLVGAGNPVQFANGRHFFGAAAEAMRRILVEKARSRKRLRHGGGRARLNLEELDMPASAEDNAGDELLALDEALIRLAGEDSSAVEVVKLRYFVGLTIKQTAEALGISVRTANRQWAYAKAYLYQQLSVGNSPGR